MRISHKITLSAIAASFIVAQGLYAVDITDDSKLVQDVTNRGNYTYSFNTGDVVKDLNLGKTLVDSPKTPADKLKYLVIKAGQGQTGALKFTAENSTVSLGDGYSFELTADSVVFQGKDALIQSAIEAENGHSVINAENGASVDYGFIRVANGKYYNKNYNGSLTINGDLKLTNSAIVNFEQADFHVNGKVTAFNSTFGAEVLDLSRVTNNGFFIMSASKGFDSGTANVAFTDDKAGNKANLFLDNQLVELSSNLMDNNYANNIATIDEKTYENQILKVITIVGKEVNNEFYDVELNQVGNGLYVKGDFAAGYFKADKSFDFDKLNADVRAYYGAQITYLEALYKKDGQIESGLFFTNKDLVQKEITKYNTETTGTIAMSKAAVDTAKTELDEAKKGNDSKKIETAQKAYDQAVEKLNNDKKTLSELNNRLAEYNKLIEDVKNKTTNLDKKITDTNFNIVAGQRGQIFASLATSSVGGKLAGTADYIFGNGRVIKDVEKSAKSNAGNSALNAPVSAINVANDMAISNRLAKLSNPYIKEPLKDVRFVANNGYASDSNYAYGARSYDNNLWANVIGGANIVDSNNGSLYGVSIGYDRLVGDNTILGTYLTYANSEIKTDLVNQESDNLQFGLYSRTLYGNNEFDFKGYFQLGWTDQDRFIAGQVNKSDFNRKFLGASGTYGYVFDMSDNLYIKPLVGANLYYAYTPDYTESGAYAQHVQSKSSFDASIEAGAEFRKYVSEENYVYVLPKIEQYLVTSGDDYTARFLGSNTSFSVKGNDKKKTYGSLMIGGDINIAKQVAFTFSAGVKHLLSGKIDDQDETYLSGNIGVKYQF